MAIYKRISREIINTTHFSREITVFHGRRAPEKGILVGYGAIIDVLTLAMPIPRKLALLGEN